MCWRSECRGGCYYPDVCSERVRVIPSEYGCKAHDNGPCPECEGQ